MLEGRWKMVIIFHLFDKTVLRFSELERAIPDVSQKMLIQQLRELERDGIVARRSLPAGAAEGGVPADRVGAGDVPGARRTARMGGVADGPVGLEDEATGRPRRRRGARSAARSPGPRQTCTPSFTEAVWTPACAGVPVGWGVCTAQSVGMVYKVLTLDLREVRFAALRVPATGNAAHRCGGSRWGSNHLEKEGRAVEILPDIVKRQLLQYRVSGIAGLLDAGGSLPRMCRSLTRSGPREKPTPPGFA